MGRPRRLHWSWTGPVRPGPGTWACQVVCLACRCPCPCASAAYEASAAPPPARCCQSPLPAPAQGASVFLANKKAVHTARTLCSHCPSITRHLRSLLVWRLTQGRAARQALRSSAAHFGLRCLRRLPVCGLASVIRITIIVLCQLPQVMQAHRLTVRDAGQASSRRTLHASQTGVVQLSQQAWLQCAQGRAAAYWSCHRCSLEGEVHRLLCVAADSACPTRLPMAWALDNTTGRAQGAPTRPQGLPAPAAWLDPPPRAHLGVGHAVGQREALHRQLPRVGQRPEAPVGVQGQHADEAVLAARHQGALIVRHQRVHGCRAACVKGHAAPTCRSALRAACWGACILQPDRPAWQTQAGTPGVSESSPACALIRTCACVCPCAPVILRTGASQLPCL